MRIQSIVIGSGFSSLSAACYLAKAGFDVTILEKNLQAGGRARQILSEGFVFDMGPTWYWMPDIFEAFFEDFGHTPGDFYQLQRLDPSYRVYFSESAMDDIPASKYELEQLFEKYQPGSGSILKEFLADAEHTYRMAVTKMAYKPGHSPFEFLSTETLSHASLFFQTFRNHIKSKFKHPYLVSLLEFPVLFLGAKPSDIPAFYHFMNYADFELGTWYPHGGMYSVVNGMVRLAENLGVKILYDKEVTGFKMDGERISGVLTKDQVYEAEVIISGADYEHTESLLPEGLKNYHDQYWEKKVFAPSALLFYLGIDKKLDAISHHTLFFDTSFDVHAESIYDNPGWPEDPLFYINIPSVTDATIAPVGKEAMTILIPIAPGITDDHVTREIYLDKVLTRFEKLTGHQVRDHIIYKQSYCVSDFIADYNAYKGNAYGMANTLFQTGYFRPSIRNKKIKNLFYTGQLTVPGGGVPPAIISGKIVAAEVMKKIRMHEYAD